MKSALITVELRMSTSGGVTASEALAAPEKVLPLHTDAFGDPHLPGTTVAGSLRSFCNSDDRLKPTDSRSDLFGNAPGNEVRTTSPIQVLGTRCVPSGEVEVRKRTAINPRRGAADTNKLYDVEQLPAGTTFTVYLRWDWEEADGRFDDFLRCLPHWHPQIGRGASSGSGQCAVTGVGHRVYDLGKADDLFAWLQVLSVEDYPAVTACTTDQQAQPIRDVQLEIVDGLHIGLPTDEPSDTTTKGVPNPIVRDHGIPVVPGSSLRGVFRSRVTYICEVLEVVTCDDRGCGDCVPCVLFGFAGVQGRAKRSKVAFRDARIEHHHVEERQHAAVDRFTGGAAPELLYTDEVVTTGRFQLHVDLLGPELEPHEQLLLDAVIADLDAGLVSIGARGTAGLGTVRITDPGWKPVQPLTELATYLAGK